MELVFEPGHAANLARREADMALRHQPPIIVHRDLRRSACVRAVIDWIKTLFAEQRDVLAGVA